MITVQQETYADVYEGCIKIFPTHWDELALDKDVIPLDPDFEAYRSIEAQGQLLVLTCRQDAAIIGYFVGFVRPDLHYKTCLTCRCDIFYIHPDHRLGKAGSMLFSELQSVCEKRGVDRIVVGSKMHKSVAIFLERLGYNEIERVHSLLLTHGTKRLSPISGD